MGVGNLPTHGIDTGFNILVVEFRFPDAVPLLGKAVNLSVHVVQFGQGAIGPPSLAEVECAGDTDIHHIVICAAGGNSIGELSLGLKFTLRVAQGHIHREVGAVPACIQDIVVRVILGTIIKVAVVFQLSFCCSIGETD